MMSSSETTVTPDTPLTVDGIGMTAREAARVMCNLPEHIQRALVDLYFIGRLAGSSFVQREHNAIAILREYHHQLDLHRQQELEDARGMMNRWMKAALSLTVDFGAAFDPMNPEAFAACHSAALAGLRDNLAAAESSRDSALSELSALKAVVDKLPKTADGVPIVPGMLLWPPCGHIPLVHMAVSVDPVTCYGDGCKGKPYYGENDYYEPGEPTKHKPEKCYSTREAALSSLTSTGDTGKAGGENV